MAVTCLSISRPEASRALAISTILLLSTFYNTHTQHIHRPMSDQDDIPFYEKPEWADVVPIPQDDGPNPLVPIAYTKECN